jgi:extracellular solute-binding protein (family 5)
MIKYVMRAAPCENMQSSLYEDSAKGIAIGILAFMFIFSAVPLQVTHAATGNGRPYFMITLEAPATNPSRRQWAAIIQNSWSNAGIGASLIYVASFTILAETVLGPNSFNLYAKGGFDAFFVGAGGGTALPDFGTQNVEYYKGATASDFPPVGSNWFWWKNDTYNALAAQYGTDFNAQERVTIAQKMVAIVSQERPGMTILYPSAVYAFAPSFNGWNTGGVAGALTATTAERDFVHWNPGTSTTINMAETGDIDNINVLDTAVQNTLYSQNVVVNLEEPSQEPDGRAVASYACDGVSPCTGIAKAIVSSADKLTWTESIRPHNFQDGVPVTADDYVFATQSQNDALVGWVGLGTIQSLIGLKTQYTYLNGTTSYINNGTYVGHNAPSGWTATSAWKSVNATAFQWTMPSAYIFTNPLVSSVTPIPKHLYEQYYRGSWSAGPLSGFTGSAGSLSKSSYTFSWNTAKYGGNGSYTAYGPVTDGPYVYHGYDSLTQTATIVAWAGYWNATGLAAIHEYTAKTIHLIHIGEKTAAISGMATGVYNVLDSQYTFNKDDEASIKAAGGLPILVSDPSNGWQALVLNDNSPVWGTGTATPLGQANPSQAHRAALLIRHAMSDLIPRQDIVNNLLQGIGAPGITDFYYSPTGSGIYHTMYAGVSPDPYDPAAAQALLAQAGYNTGTGTTVTLPTSPTVSANCTTTAAPGTLVLPQFLLGNSMSFQGTFLVAPGAYAGKGGAAITLQQTTDNGTTWTPVVLASTNEGAYYSFSYQPTVTGYVEYRVFFTGIPWTYINSQSISSPGRAESLAPPQANLNQTTGKALTPPNGNGLKPQNTTDIQYGLITGVRIGSLADVFASLTTNINTNTANGLCGLDKSLSGSTTTALGTLSNNINTALNQLSSTSAKSSDVSTVTYVAYAALAVAIILGLAAIFLARRKPS